MVGAGQAQVNAPLLERFFLPIASYRLASTATLLEGDLDRMLDPAVAGTIQGQRIYSALSDLFLQEQLFNNVSLGRWVLAGIGPATAFGRPVGLGMFRNTRTPLLTTRGTLGEFVLDSLHYFSTLGPNPPDRREEIHVREETYALFGERALLAGLVRKTWGLYLLHQATSQRTIPTGSELNPFGQFSYSYTLREHPSGTTLYTRSIQGEAQRSSATSFWGIVGGYTLSPNLRLSAGLVLTGENRKDTARYAGTEDRAPGSGYDRVYRQGVSRIEEPWSGIGLVAELRMDRASRTTRVGFIVQNERLQDGQTVLDTLLSQEALLVDTALNRYHEVQNTSLSGKRSMMGVFATWSQRYAYARGTFVIGAATGYIRTQETRDLLSRTSTSLRVTDGDGVPLDPDDFTQTSSQEETRKQTRETEEVHLDLPVALEFRPHHQAPLLLRIGGLYSLRYIRDVFTDEGLSSTPREVRTVTDAGDTTLQHFPVDLQSSQTVVRTLTSTLTFSYGAALPVGPHFLFEVMGFATLTDLRGWRVSLTWIP